MEENNGQVMLSANSGDDNAQKSGNQYKGRRELITDYWCKMKKEFRLAGKEYGDAVKAAHIAEAKAMFPDEGKYLIDAEGNISFLKPM